MLDPVQQGTNGGRVTLLRLDDEPQHPRVARPEAPVLRQRGGFSYPALLTVPSFAALRRHFCFSKARHWSDTCSNPVERRAEGRVVLNNLSEQIRECLEHAEDCACKAAAQPDGSRMKQDYLDLEKKWRSLARSFQLGERLTDFTSYTNGNASAPIIPFLRGQAFDPDTIETMGQAFVTTCETLGLSEHDALTQIVAQKIIELAQRGLKNSTALHLAAIKEFKSDPH